MHFILDAKDNGAKYVVIDPFFTADAGKADVFLGVNPATDGAVEPLGESMDDYSMTKLIAEKMSYTSLRDARARRRSSAAR